MAFDNIKEELKENAIELWGRIQDSPAYNSLHEQYENLSPTMQRLLLFALVAIVVLLLVMIPYSYFSSSSDNNDQYVTNRNLVRQLLRANSLAGQSLNSPQTVDSSSLKNKITSMLSSIPLLPSQNGGVTDIKLGDLGPGIAVGELHVSGVGLNLKKLNLKQVVNIGYQLESKYPNVKLAGIDMTANSTNRHYFDVQYKLAVYNLPGGLAHSLQPPSQRGGSHQGHDTTTE